MMIMMMMSSRIALLLLWLLSTSTVLLLLLCDGINGDDVIVCGEKERAALLSFKQGLKDPSNRLSSWSSLPQLNDCCTWTGVRCNNLTGRVIELHLSTPLYDHFDIEDEYESYLKKQLGGNITPSLLELEYLTYLDLSQNNFTNLNVSYSIFDESIPIPHQLGNLSTLRVLDLSRNYYLHLDNLSWITHLHSLEYLNMTGIDLHNATNWHQSISMIPSLSELLLSNCNLQGLIPHQLGNLSTLHHLDLSDNFLYVDDLSWIAGLHSLEYLNMGSVDLHKPADSLQVVSMLPSLSELHLRGCQLGNMIPPLLVFVNFTSLTVFDLSSNNFNCKISDLLFNLTSSSLLSLYLFNNSLYGHIPGSISNLQMLSNLDLGFNTLITGQIADGIGQLKHLESLFLDVNSLSGPIPPSIGNLSSLRTLYLSDNQLNGTLPKSMGFLSNLESLYVDNNFLAGIVSEVHFATLSKLKTLSMSSNSLFFNVSSNWVPPFQLDQLSMSSCKKIGPRFPSWLPTQTSLTILDISHSGILGATPEWLWKWVSHINYINLSHNQINGDISNVLLNSSAIDLSSNHFEGQLPHLSPNVQVFNLANNFISGPICPILCEEINRESKLKFLDLSNNMLSGGISCCWIHFPYLTYVKLGRNNLSGKIPNSMGSMGALESLQLRNNNFSGKIPLSLQNCTSLSLIDLGENTFIGLIPSWIGEMTNIRVLRLRSNKLIGNIPSEICHLSELIVLDLGNNRLSGPIPNCMNNISAMAFIDASEHGVIITTLSSQTRYIQFEESIWLITKGMELEYTNILELVRSIDLSANNLSGSIPMAFSSLHALRFLNLSRNQITGEIPVNIGGMTMLESLDLSRSHLSGEIPQTMSNLTFLSYLDLSYNNFSGKIPSSTQLQSFNATSYIGNDELCGAPLNNNCTRGEESQDRGVTSIEKEEEEYEMVWFYIAMGPGFAVGFWVVCGTLLVKRTWRHAYFQLLDDAKDWIYLAIMLKLNRIHRKFKRYNVV